MRQDVIIGLIKFCFLVKHKLKSVILAIKAPIDMIVKINENMKI